MSGAEAPATAAKAPAALREASRFLGAWLVEKAYPLWWRVGADRDFGGYHDKLDRSGRPTLHPKRARVAARQVYCFAQASELGWDGPWRRAMRHGLQFLEREHLRKDGLYRGIVDPSAEPRDESAELYDQAFVLLALASSHRHGQPAAEARAHALLQRLSRHPLGGFRELQGQQLRSNPNMHLFEAFLAWAQPGGEPPWRELAESQAKLAMSRLADPVTGAIAEIYADDWRPAPGRFEREISPGHQFEWAWLLMRMAAMSAAREPMDAAVRLIELAERSGVDPKRKVAMNAVDGDLRPRDADARLWPQTERLKATLLAARLTGDPNWWSAAENASEGLNLYLEDSGLWRDRLSADGLFIDEPAPASSFYHLVGAILELKRAVGAGPLP